MTVTVSVSELRGNISQYLDRVMKGSRVLIRDEKKDITIAQITKTHLFDAQMYEQVLRKAAGVLSAENHPEWKAKSDVSKWLAKSRRADERSF